jgi:DNA-binding transcriptional LysR family regulator
MGLRIDLKQLGYFRAAARAGSLTAAARNVSISQPTLSIAIRRLEAALATTLLHRHRDGVTLTATGTELLGRCDEILASVERAEQAVLGIESEPVGRFVIGCPEALGAFFLPEFIKRMAHQSPRIEFSLWSGTSREVERAVLHRVVDFGLVSRMFPHPELVGVHLFRDHTELFATGPAPRTIQAAKQRLLAGPLLYIEGSAAGSEIMRSLARRRLLPERWLQCGTLELAKSLALGSAGIAILPRRVAECRTEALCSLHPTFPSIEDTISLVYRADFHRTRAAMHVRSSLVTHGRTL